MDGVYCFELLTDLQKLLFPVELILSATPGHLLGGTDSIANGLIAGIYTITVTVNNGCQATDNVVVSQPDTFTIAPFGILDSDCFGANTGEASAMAFRGTIPYIYTYIRGAIQWLKLEPQHRIFQLVSGLYCD